MRSNTFQSILRASALASAVMAAGAGAALAAPQVISLTAGPATATLPDGSTVPMWGYSCGTAAAGSTATCAPLNPAAAGNPAMWSPVVITVPTNTDLQINLTNNLAFTPAVPGAIANLIPTSLTIVGQLGGGLGSSATNVASPPHAPQGVTWPTANTGANFTPPPQGPRVQSFALEVPAGATAGGTAAGSPAAPCWGPSCATPSTHSAVATRSEARIVYGASPKIQGALQQSYGSWWSGRASSPSQRYRFQNPVRSEQKMRAPSGDQDG